MSDDTPVVVLIPERENVAGDLRKYADLIEAGTIPATCVLLIVHDRMGRTIGTKVAGELESYSQLMGLCAYASCQLYKDANK